MRKILTLLGVVAVLLLMPTNAKAWGDLYLLNNIWGSWGPADTNSDYKFTKVNDSEFTYTLDASNHSGDIYWRINTPSDYDGKREIRPDNDGQEVGVSGYNAKYDESYSDKSFKISHSTNNYTHYTITVRWDTGGGGFWNVKVEGSGSKVYTSSVYLLGTINSWSGTDYPVVYQGGSEWKLSLTKEQVDCALWQGDFYFRFIENMNTGTQYGVYPNVDQTSLTVNDSYNTDTYATTNTTTDDKKDYYWKFTPTGADNYNIYFNHDGDTRSEKLRTTVLYGICTATLAVPTTGRTTPPMPLSTTQRRGTTKERSRSQKSVEQKTATCASVSTTALIRGDRRSHRMLSTTKARSRTRLLLLAAQATTSPSPRTLSLPRSRQSRQRVGGY